MRPGWPSVQECQEHLKLGAFSFGVHLHRAVVEVAHPAPEAQLPGLGLGGVAEADALDAAAHERVQAGGHGWMRTSAGVSPLPATSVRARTVPARPSAGAQSSSRRGPSTAAASSQRPSGVTSRPPALPAWAVARALAVSWAPMLNTVGRCARAVKYTVAFSGGRRTAAPLA